MAEISVIVPVYMAEECLKELCGRLKNSLKGIADNFEIIFVEDCGGDKSWNIITELAKSDKRIKGIRLCRNFGQHYAITAGLDNCDGDWVVVMDCDLQDRPEEIPRLYNKAREGFDVVLAKKIKRKDRPVTRFTSWMFYKVFSYLADTDYDWRVGNFRIISRRVAKNFSSMHERLRFFGGLVDWMGFPGAYIEVEHSERFEGKTSYNFRRRWRLALDAIIAYSDKPLRLTIYLGFFMAILSFIFGCYNIARVLIYGSPVSGWGSLIVSLYFIGGMIIFTLGVIGIYIGKTFDETKKRPLYIIKDTINSEKR
jgi:polyisoprenyl-phosphate glycosyltransferase